MVTVVVSGCFAIALLLACLWTAKTANDEDSENMGMLSFVLLIMSGLSGVVSLNASIGL